MAEPVPVTHFYPSWRLVCQAGVFLGLVVGLSILIARSQLTEVYAVIHGVDQRVQKVQETTREMEQNAVAAKDLVASNNAILVEQTGMTQENEQMLASIKQLFADIATRQQEILQAIAHVHTTADQVRSSADTLTTLLQARTQLLQETAQGVQALLQQRCPAGP